MSREIPKREKPVEQVNDSESLEYKLKSRGRLDQQAEASERIKIGELLGKAREKLYKVYEKQKSNSEEAEEQTEEQTKVSADEFFNEAKSEEGNIKLSPVGKIVESVSNTKSSQEVRDKTAKEKMPEVIKALGEMGYGLENIKNNIKKALSLGAGLGENIGYLAKELEIKNVVGIDKNTVVSRKVQEEMGDKLTWIKGDALKEIKSLEENAFNLSELTAYLQVLNREDKIKILREAGRVSELVVVVDELKRDGLRGFRDLFMNKLYNAGMGKYEVLKDKEWEEVFEEAGLFMKVFNKFGKNDVVIILEKMKEKAEE